MNAGQKLVIQHRDALGLIVEIVGRVLVRAQVIRLLVGSRLVGQLGLGEPDILPYLFHAHRFIQIFTNQQRLTQLIKTETAAGALHRVFALAIAVDDPPDTLGSDGFGVIHHLHQDEFAMAAVGLVHVQDGVGGGAGAGEGVEDDRIWI